METILNILKAGLPRDLSSLSINNLVAYDSELDYNAARGSERENNSDRIPTQLSRNPSQYEKDLRNIVLELYSDRVPLPDKEPRDVISMDPYAGVHISSSVATPSYEIVKLQADFSSSGPSLDGSYLSDDIRNPPILYRYEETALTNKDPQSRASNQRQQAPSLITIKTVKQIVDSKSNPGGVSRRDASLISDLQQSLQTFEVADAEELSRHRYGSTESEFVTPSFSDSGIQLEFSSVDNDVTSECESVKEPNEYRDGNAVEFVDANENEEKGGQSPTSLSINERDGFENTVQNKSLVIPSPSSPVVLIRTSSPIRTEKTIITKNLDPTRIPYAIQRYEFVDGSKDGSAQDDDLQLGLANMEGKLESLETEYREVLEERKELQNKLTIHEDKAKKSIDSHDAKPMYIELEKLRERESRLKIELTQLQQTNEDKDLHVKDVEEKLQSSQFRVRNLLETLKTLEAEAKSKANCVQTLEKELEALKGILAETRLQYEGSFNEKVMLSSDMSTLVNAKSWLMKQLETSKEAQVKLQLEVSEYESTVFAQNNQVEQLKCDSARVVQKLTETQEKAMREKGIILEHLEMVESDLVNQDVAFRKMHTEKDTVQRALEVKIDSLQRENTLLQNLTKSANQLEQELATLKTQAEAKANLLNKLDKEKDEVIHQLKVARNVNEVYEKNIKALKFKLQDNEKKLVSLADEQATRDVNIQELKYKNAELVDSIREAQEEKDALDSAVQLLRLELDKVERRFKMMKRELTLKANQLEEVSKQKDGFINELRVLRDEMEQHKTLLENLRDTIRLRDETIKTLQSGKAKLHAEARVLGERLQSTQMAFDETHKDKEKLYEQLRSSNSELSSLEKKFYDSCLEKAKLEGEIESTKRASTDYAHAKQAENESLKQEMNELQSTLQYEATRHRDEAINLKQEVEYMKGQMSQTNEQHKDEVESLENNLAQMEETKQQEQVELKKHYECLQRTSVHEAKETFERNMTEKEQELMAVKEEKELLSFKCTELEERARNTAALQQDRIISLENELHLARHVLEEQKRELEKRLMISIELEREKGRLAGLRTSQKALRDHCANLETVSAKRESKISELQAKLENITQEKESEGKEALRKVTQLEANVKADGERIDDLRLRLDSERKDKSQLRVQLNESEHEAEKVLKKLTKACVELENISSKYEKCTKELQDNNVCQRALLMDLQSSQMLVRKLENELRIIKERDKVKDDLASALQWKFNQRCKELNYAKDQLRLADERHQSELETLRTVAQVANSEASYLRREVSLARKSKCEKEQKYFTSRDELLATRQVTETTKQDLFAATQQLRYLKSAILNSCDVKELQEFVKNDEELSHVTKVTLAVTNQEDPNIKSSLSSLRECMSSLREQISTLQDQMNKHTDAICTTASSWRSFEKNVQNLQTECAAVQKKSQLWSAEKDISGS